jgi:hypothetical protein
LRAFFLPENHVSFFSYLRLLVNFALWQSERVSL